MSETIAIQNVILFARAGFRGLQYSEAIMEAVAKEVDGMEIQTKSGKTVGKVTQAEVVGSLIRGDVEMDAAFLKTEEGESFIRRTGAKFEEPEEKKPTKKAAPEKKAVTKAPAPSPKSAPKTAGKPVILKSVKSVKKPTK